MKVSISIIVGLVLGLTQVCAQIDLDYCDLSKLRYRKNLNKLTQAQWDKYVNAVKVVNSGNRLTTWDKFIKMHVDHYKDVHSTLQERKPLFLAWHRLYLYYIEKELQKVDESVTIPYWDWTEHNRDVRNNIAFSDRFFGGQSVDRSNCIVNGRFKDFKVGVLGGGPTRDSCIMRRNDIFNYQFTDFDVMDTQYVGADSFDGFNLIEFNPHGNIHNSIGGSFSGHASPGDPLFYSHHAFIDKLWWDWQSRHVSKSAEYSAPLNKIIQPFNVKLKHVIDPLDRLCVTYKMDRFSWVGSRINLNTRSAAPAANSAPEKYTVPSNITDIKQLEEYDNKYIKSGLMDFSMLRTDADVTKIPDAISIEYLNKMNIDVSLFRELERRDAKALDAINQIRMFN